MTDIDVCVCEKCDVIYFHWHKCVCDGCGCE